jgi:iron-sulfur cluster assembly protein
MGWLRKGAATGSGAPDLRSRALNPWDRMDEMTMSGATPASGGAARKPFKVMTLSDAAAERVRAVIAAAEKPIAGIRVGVRNGGCAGMAYTMDYAEAKNPHDEVIEDKGVTVLIDPKAVLFLLGTEMDVKTDKFASTFVFKNPNETSACGCGESVAITPATPEPAKG